MPTLDKVFRIDITPEQFLIQCSQSELMEVQLLIHSYHYKSKMKAFNCLIMTSEEYKAAVENIVKAISPLSIEESKKIKT